MRKTRGYILLISFFVILTYQNCGDISVVALNDLNSNTGNPNDLVPDSRPIQLLSTLALSSGNPFPGNPVQIGISFDSTDINVTSPIFESELQSITPNLHILESIVLKTPQPNIFRIFLSALTSHPTSVTSNMNKNLFYEYNSSTNALTLIRNGFEVDEGAPSIGGTQKLTSTKEKADCNNDGFEDFFFNYEITTTNPLRRVIACISGSDLSILNRTDLGVGSTGHIWSISSLDGDPIPDFISFDYITVSSTQYVIYKGGANQVSIITNIPRQINNQFSFAQVLPDMNNDGKKEFFIQIRNLVGGNTFEYKYHTYTSTPSGYEEASYSVHTNKRVVALGQFLKVGIQAIVANDSDPNNKQIEIYDFSISGLSAQPIQIITFAEIQTQIPGLLSALYSIGELTPLRDMTGDGAFEFVFSPDSLRRTHYILDIKNEAILKKIYST